MPRSLHRVTDSPEATALDEAARVFDEAEAAFDAARKALINAMVVADAAKISKAEIGRRTGYTREHVSKLISDELRRRAEQEQLDEGGFPDFDGTIRVAKSALHPTKNGPGPTRRRS